MEIRYHRKALELMGLTPEFSKERIRKIETFEKQHGCGLPAAVRELFSLSGVEEWFLGVNQDRLLRIEELRLERHEEFLEDEDLKLKGLSSELFQEPAITFMVENQGVCWWEVILNGSDDPPVLVPLHYESNTWMIAQKHFSDFFLAVTFDHALLRKEETLWDTSDHWSGKDLPGFKRLPTTYGWPMEDPKYRYQKGSLLLSIHGGESGDIWISGWKNEKELEEIETLLEKN
ncbi:hypothetical protein ACFO25_05325 [Paenactinomyces guangxiensis]|uniref:Knr4/Smi1-like domain-containing protein n=1 Tax=Paenactinomyces guangxiensis TaxID=1490290 RepID=A0A7W2A869_9BACL|nr:hypothetical protein [Paenactinomyces guangxiensis]MBA4494345.1 hypothetical protein [Paenactinomyces guangxiensis]MBH8590840.1 hypothetical protein [Paenactinomyces guangxiensis]